MSEARKLLQQIEEGVENDLYALIRNPKAPEWLKKVMLKAAQEPDHADTAFWLRHLADSLDGQKTASSPNYNNPNQSLSSVSPPSQTQQQTPQPTQTAQPTPTPQQPSQAPQAQSAPAANPTTSSQPATGASAPADNTNNAVPAASAVEAIFLDPKTPDWVNHIIKLPKGTSAGPVAKWLEWLASIALDPNVTDQHLSGVMAHDQVPAWVKQAANLADSDHQPAEQTGAMLQKLAAAYQTLVPPKAPKAPKAQKQGVRDVLMSRLNKPPAPQGNGGTAATDLLQGRLDPNLLSAYGDVDHDADSTNVRFD